MAYKKFTKWVEIREANAANSGDPQAFNQAVTQSIDQQQGGNKTAAGAKAVDPKGVMNKAVLDAAKADPTAASKALNIQPTDKPMMKKKQKKR